MYSLGAIEYVQNLSEFHHEEPERVRQSCSGFLIVKNECKFIVDLYLVINNMWITYYKYTLKFLVFQAMYFVFLHVICCQSIPHL